MAGDVPVVINRRAFIAGSMCACCTRRSSEAQHFSRSDCILYQAAPENDQSGLPGLSRLDFSQDFENGLVIVLRQLSELLQLNASFGLYDDPVRSPNAVASLNSLLPAMDGSSAPDGTVALGRKLIDVHRTKTANLGASISAVSAHEYGHLLQYKSVYGDLRKLTNRKVRIELHADFVCGYFAAHRRRVQPNYPAAIQAITQYRYGDAEYIPVSHGTKDQRGDAVYAGFLLGRDGVVDPKVVAAKGFEYVRKLEL
jgi:hypothetical protein